MIPWLLPLGMCIAEHRWGCCRCAWGGTVPFGCACAVRKGHLPWGCHPATGADFLTCVSVNQPSVGVFQEGGGSRSSGLDSSGSARRCHPGANTQLCAGVGEYCRQLVLHIQRAKRGAVGLLLFPSSHLIAFGLQSELFAESRDRAGGAHLCMGMYGSEVRQQTGPGKPQSSWLLPSTVETCPGCPPATGTANLNVHLWCAPSK